MIFGAVVVALALAAETPDAQEVLGQEFWRWRAETQPASGDDIPRLTRPPGWVPDWSPASIVRRREALARFEKRWRALPVGADVAGEVDRRLLGSALARVHWELDVLAGWRRNPDFYVQQSLGSTFELLVIPAPFDEQRAQDVVRRLEAVPGIVDAARANLDQMRGPFVRVALASLKDVRAQLTRMAQGLKAVLPGPAAQTVGPAAEKAAVTRSSSAPLTEE